MQERSVPKPVFTDAEAGAKEFPDSDSRRFNYYIPAKRKQSHYEDVTVEVQPDPRHYLSQGWLYGFADGRGGYPLDWTALKAWGVDRPEPERYPGSGGKGYDWPAHGWHEFRDPNEEWELTLYRYNSNVVRQVNQNVENARQSKAFEQWNPNWVHFVERNVGAWMHVDHGLGLYLYANAQRRAPTNMHNNAISVNSMHRIRAAQDLALYNLTLTEEVPGFDGAAHLETWKSDPAWQGVREIAEQLTSIWDWGEAIFAGNVVFEPLVGGAAHRRLRDADERRRGRVRLRRARPALHPGDVRAAHHRPGVRRSQQDAAQRLADRLGAAGAAGGAHHAAAVVAARPEAAALRGRP
jgi:propane monooxygenase small subunit